MEVTYWTGFIQNFQDECEAKLQVLEEAASSSQKMTYHQDADEQVAKFQVRWGSVHETAKEWVARMTTLVECWNKLDGNVGELSSRLGSKNRATVITTRGKQVTAFEVASLQEAV